MSSYRLRIEEAIVLHIGLYIEIPSLKLHLDIAL